jgi:sugar phosphate permease
LADDVHVEGRRWKLVALLLSGMTLCYAQRGTLSVAVRSVKSDFGINNATMGLMLSAFSWSYCFMQVPSGWIVDRFGVRRAYAYGSVYGRSPASSRGRFGTSAPSCFSG